MARPSIEPSRRAVRVTLTLTPEEVACLRAVALETGIPMARVVGRFLDAGPEAVKAAVGVRVEREARRG